MRSPDIRAYHLVHHLAHYLRGDCTVLRLAYFLLFIQLTTLAMTPSAEAGKIERVSDSLRSKQETPKPSRPKRKLRTRRKRRSNRHHGRGTSTEDAATGAAMATAIAYALATPFSIPNLALTTHYPDYHGVPAEPYPDKPKRNSKGTLTSPDNDFAFRVGAQFTLGREQSIVSALTSRLDFRNRFTLAADYRLFTESPLNRPNRAWAGLGEATLLWRFAESPRIRFHAGFGYGNWLDRHGPVHSLLLHYSFEVYPISPISFGSHVAAGPAGQSYIVRWKSHLGFVIHHWELQLAYDYINIADIRFGGPMLGVQLHM